MKGAFQYSKVIGNVVLLPYSRLTMILFSRHLQYLVLSNLPLRRLSSRLRFDSANEVDPQRIIFRANSVPLLSCQQAGCNKRKLLSKRTWNIFFLEINK